VRGVRGEAGMKACLPVVRRFQAGSPITRQPAKPYGSINSMNHSCLSVSMYLEGNTYVRTCVRMYV
jgi:hypothetical protein